jgi:hypothetical protein
MQYQKTNSARLSLVLDRGVVLIGKPEAFRTGGGKAAFNSWLYKTSSL